MSMDQTLIPYFVPVFTDHCLRTLCTTHQGFYCYPKPPLMIPCTFKWDLYRKTYFDVLKINLRIARHRHIPKCDREHYKHYVLNFFDDYKKHIASINSEENHIFSPNFPPQVSCQHDDIKIHIKKEKITVLTSTLLFGPR